MTSDLQALVALAARVAALEAAELARAVLYSYAAAVDTRDWASLRACFADDAVMVMGSDETIGADSIVDSLRSMLPAEFITQHLLVNPTVVAHDGATVAIEATVYYLHEGTGYEGLGWGTYRNTVVVGEGHGVIARMEFVPAQHLPGSVGTVARRVQDLETVEAARQATWRYAQAVDGPDLDLLADVFTEDAVLVSRSGAKEGREAVIDYYRRALEAPVGRKHLLTNQDVELVAPGEAIVRSYFAYTYAGTQTSVLGWGSYVDTVRVVDGIGRIAEKRISIDASGDVHPGWASEE